MRPQRNGPQTWCRGSPSFRPGLGVSTAHRKVAVRIARAVDNKSLGALKPILGAQRSEAALSEGELSATPRCASAAPTTVPGGASWAILTTGFQISAQGGMHGHAFAH